MTTRSIHFPPPTTPEKEPAQRPANALEVFAATLSDSQLLWTKAKELLISTNRHGDLQVMLAATRRIEAALIEIEERT